MILKRHLRIGSVSGLPCCHFRDKAIFQIDFDVFNEYDILWGKGKVKMGDQEGAKPPDR